MPTNDLTATQISDVVDRRLTEIDPQYFKSKRWFGSKNRTIAGYRVVERGALQSAPNLWYFLLIEIAYRDADPEIYYLPLAISPQDRVPASVRNHPYGIAFTVQSPLGWLAAYDAYANDDFCVDVYRGMAEDRAVSLPSGQLVSRHVPGLIEDDAAGSITRIGTEQSNSSIVFGGGFILKAYRKVAAGLNPDVEVPYFLTTETDFRHVPRVAGFREYRSAGSEPVSIGVLQEYVINQGDGFTNATNWARDYLTLAIQFGRENRRWTARQRQVQGKHLSRPMPRLARRLGTVTGELHGALASREEPEAFRPEPVTTGDVSRWSDAAGALIRRSIADARAAAPTLPASDREMLHAIAQHEGSFLTMTSGLDVLSAGGFVKTRIHGDYHLGQVLQTDGDFMILDFEGEPARSMDERRAKSSPLRDVAGLLRSFDYAVHAALFELWQQREIGASERPNLDRWVAAWVRLARNAFLDGYREAIEAGGDPRLAPNTVADFDRVLRVFEVEKAFYELSYELNNRPAWVPIPARGLLRMVEGSRRL